MKFPSKKLLGVLGVAISTWSFTGCLAEAEETLSGGSVDDRKETSQLAGAHAEASLSNSNTPVALSTNAAVSLTNDVSGTNSLANTGTNTNAEDVVLSEVPPSPPVDLKLSKGIQDVIKLAQSGVSDTVLLLYIENASEPFDLDASKIVYLNDIGISNPVIAAMLQHDGANPELAGSLTNSVETASAPDASAVGLPPATNWPGQLQVSSNYIATGAEQVAVAPQPQQQVVVQQQPIVVQQPVVVTEPAVTYSYFYSSLAPYGSWVELPDYGWCWRPTITVVHSGWRPYAHGGRWLYSDAGWYWHSDYSWGWAPFHYGRWYCSPRVGWVWTPGYTWAPSWVTWRRGADYCGWAPLPPHTRVRSGVGFSYWNHNVGFSFDFGLRREHFTFVPTRHFYNRRVLDHVVPTERTANIYNNSTVVNNYIVGNNNTVINRGISREYVSTHSGSEIRPIAVRDEPRGPGRAIHPDRIERKGSELVVYRPAPPSPAVVNAHQRAAERVASNDRPLEARAAERSSSLPPRGSGHAESGVVRRTPSAGSPEGIGGTALASRSSLPRPAFGIPAPVRPEPQPRVTSLPSRTTFRSGAEVRPGQSTTGRIATGPSATVPPVRAGNPTVRTPGASLGGRNESRNPISTANPGATLNRPAPAPGAVARPIPGTTRPSPFTVPPSTTPSNTGRSEAPRTGLGVRSGNFGASAGPTARPAAPSKAPTSPPIRTPSPQQVPQSRVPQNTRPAPPVSRPAPAPSGGRREGQSSLVRPGSSSPASASLTTPRPGSYTIIRSPQGAAQNLSSGPIRSVPSISSSSSGPSATRPIAPPRGSISLSQQPIRSGSQFSSSARAAAPGASLNVPQRTESVMQRQAAVPPRQIQRTPVLQPRTITRVAPQPIQSIPSAPRQAAPARSIAPAPVQRQAPTPQAVVRSAPVSRPQFNSGRPVQAARPATIQSSRSPQSSGRGRVEIGR